MKDQFITLDMGETKKLSGLNMYASKLFGTDFFPTDFQIQVSRDNVTWANINIEQGYTPPLQPPYNDNWSFDNLECRYLRINITKSKTLFFFFHLAQIAEIEVYGCNIENYVPLLAEENSFVMNGQEDEINKKKGSDNLTGFTKNVPSTPGKPVIKFLE